MYKIGIDVGGTRIKLGLVKGNKIIGFKSVRTVPDKLSLTCRKAVNRLLKRFDITEKDLKGIGVAFPGPTKDNVVLRAANLGFDHYNVKEEFGPLFPGVPIYSANDANAAALGEFKFAKTNHLDACMITLGTGIGGGLILNGELVEGAWGYGGEIGHMHSCNPYQFECGCGNVGCVETVGSATGIKRIMRHHLKLKESVLTYDSTAKDIFDAAKKNDQLALDVVDEWAGYVAELCVNVSVILNPSLFIVGGGVSAAGAFLLEKIHSKYIEKTSFPDLKDIEFRLATLGNDAGILGAAMLVK